MIYELRSNGERSAILPEGGRATGEFPRLLQVTSAGSWIAAKAAFGFELTDLQQRMLDGRATHFEIYGRTFGFADLRAMFADPCEKRGRPRAKREQAPLAARPTPSASDIRRAWKNGWIKELAPRPEDEEGEPA